jgi:hypothetical protein
MNQSNCFQTRHNRQCSLQSMMPQPCLAPRIWDAEVWSSGINVDQSVAAVSSSRENQMGVSGFGYVQPMCGNTCITDYIIDPSVDDAIEDFNRRNDQCGESNFGDDIIRRTKSRCNDKDQFKKLCSPCDDCSKNGDVCDRCRLKFTTKPLPCQACKPEGPCKKCAEKWNRKDCSCKDKNKCSCEYKSKCSCKDKNRCSCEYKSKCSCKDKNKCSCNYKSKCSSCMPNNPCIDCIRIQTKYPNFHLPRRYINDVHVYVPGRGFENEHAAIIEPCTDSYFDNVWIDYDRKPECSRKSVVPSYIVRSNIDHLPFANHIGYENTFIPGDELRLLANDAFTHSTIQFRTEMQESLMRKRNSEMWQIRAAPKYQ